MRISDDPTVDALSIRCVEGPVECEVLRLNDRVAVALGPQEQVVGIEVREASEALPGVAEGKVQRENLVPAEPAA